MSADAIRRFKARVEMIKANVRANVGRRMFERATREAEAMVAAAPKDEGTLAGTVRIIDNSKVTAHGGFVNPSLKIKAGGAATLRRSAKSGEVYDYAAATEFGNEHVAAQPWFYTTHRHAKARYFSSMKESVAEAIKANRQIPEWRAEGVGTVRGGRHKGVVTGPQRR